MLFLPVKFAIKGFLILSLSLAENSVHSRRPTFVERVYPAAAGCRGARMIHVVILLVPASVPALLQELVAEW